LEVRSATATIEVIGSAPVLDTTTPTISTTFELKQMDLPTVSQGSGVLNLSLLTAGVATAERWARETVRCRRPASAYNNFTVEGIDNNSKSVTAPGADPNDSIQEFTDAQNVYSPEFGHSDGGQFNYVLKSATNRSTAWDTNICTLERHGSGVQK